MLPLRQKQTITKKIRAQLIRWTLIVRKIQSHPYISFKSLQREMERELVFRGYNPTCSDATLKRDIRELRDELGIDIDYSPLYKGYHIQTLEKDWLDIDGIIEPLEMLTALGTDDGLPDYISFEKYQIRGTQHLSYLIHAIRDKRKIRFNYYKYADKSRSARILSPHAIKEWRGRWYVIGKDEKGGFKTFGLDRMEKLEITTDTFRKDGLFDLARKFEYSYGIYSSTEYPIEDILLALDNEDGNYLLSRPLHPSQQVVETKENEVIIRMRLRITPDFIMELLSRSWSVRILQPESLRTQVCDIYKEALTRNSP